MESAEANGPRRLLAEAWDHHLAASRAERPNALAPLAWLEARLAGAAAQRGPITAPRVALPQLSMSGLISALPRLAAPKVDEAKLARGLLSACALLLVLAVAALGTVPSRARVAEHTASGLLAAKQTRLPDDRPAITSQVLPLGAAAAPSPVPPIVPAARGALPVGKGMWLWKPEAIEGGNPEAVVIKAHQAGLTHLYVRTGSSVVGFNSSQYLNDLLPRAHRMGLRVYGWDFPYFSNVQDDVNRALTAIRHEAPGGHRLDGFTADIELRSMGVNITPETAFDYGVGLRKGVGPNYPLIATVPRPSSALVTYPFAHVASSFDAVAPMVYWLGRDPGADVAGAIRDLSVLNKPIIPVGQAYDGFAEGGPPGVPSRGEIQRFIQVADEQGAIGVSFWSWQHATREAWDAVRDAPQFSLPSTPPGAPIGFTPGQIRMYQALLSSLGFATPTTGQWSEDTTLAVRRYQEAARLPVTGIIDHATRALLLTPFPSPLG